MAKRKLYAIAEQDYSNNIVFAPRVAGLHVLRNGSNCRVSCPKRGAKFWANNHGKKWDLKGHSLNDYNYDVIGPYPGPMHRLLSYSEEIRPGDEYYTPEGHWTACDKHVGVLVNVVVRRLQEPGE